MKSKRLLVAVIMITTVATLSCIRFGVSVEGADVTSGAERQASAPTTEAGNRSNRIGMHEEGSMPDIDLFTGGGGDPVSWDSKTPAAHRARAITPDPALLKEHPVLKVGDHLTLPLFDDAVLETMVSNVTPYPNGSVGMTAQLQGKYRGTVYLSYCGGELRMHADVLGGNDFYVRYDPSRQIHVALEVDGASSDDLDDRLEAPVPQRPLLAGRTALGDTPAESGLPKVVSDPSADVVVDVMVVYTPAALAYEGSVSGINNNIALAMQKGNEAHGNSDTGVTLYLVHSALVDYTEAEVLDGVYGSPVDDLFNLTFTGGTNSAMDEVQTLRDTYRVDLICLFEYTERTGGLGWLLELTSGEPDYGFCLARVQQSDWTYTVVHEWGHNMGCSHSKSQEIQPWESDDLFTYSAGWQWNDSASSYYGYCSIMTYEDHDGDGYDDYEQVPYFSNPDINYTGSSSNPTGHAEDGDNARTIRNIRQAIADYRQSSATITLHPFSSTDDGFAWQVEHRLYSISWSSNLLRGFTVLQTNVTAGSVYTDTLHAGEPTGFYKLEAQTAP